MGFRTQKIRQGLISLLAILSMSVSSIAACACAHHGQIFETETKSCHSTGTGSLRHQSEDTEADNSGSSFKDSCLCIRSSVDTPVKAEAFKFKKVPVTSSRQLDLERVLFSSVVLNSTLESSLIVRSKLFAGSKSTRGPPSL